LRNRRAARHEDAASAGAGAAAPRAAEGVAMTSERIQRRVERLLDQAEQAADEKRWSDVEALVHEVLALDEVNADALAMLKAAERLLGTSATTPSVEPDGRPQPDTQPTSFAN